MPKHAETGFKIHAEVNLGNKHVIPKLANINIWYKYVNYQKIPYQKE